MKNSAIRHESQEEIIRKIRYYHLETERYVKELCKIANLKAPLKFVLDLKTGQLIRINPKDSYYEVCLKHELNKIALKYGFDQPYDIDESILNPTNIN